MSNSVDSVRMNHASLDLQLGQPREIPALAPPLVSNHPTQPPGPVPVRPNVPLPEPMPTPLELLEKAMGQFIVMQVLNTMKESERVMQRTDAYVKELINEE